LVFGFVASSKTSGLPSHKRRLTSWTPPRNDPNRSWPNCLMSSTRRARRSALDFVGFVIVISKNPLTDRAPARRPDFVGQRAGVRALRLRPVWGCSPNEAGGGGDGHRKSLRKFFAGFQSIPVRPGSRSVPISFLGRKRRPIKPHFIIRSIPSQCGPHAAFGFDGRRIGLGLRAAKAAWRATTSATMTARARGLVPSLGMRSYCRLHNGLLPGAGRFTGGVTIHFRRWERDA
jgi:hypothetical protein